MKWNREKKTIRAMISIHCRRTHRKGKTLCPECEELLAYALGRIDGCPYGEKKPVCSRCPIHCYRPDMRNRIREVMRFAGPRMLWRHPVFTLWHSLHAMRRVKSCKIPNK